MQKHKLSRNIKFNLILFGFVGQVAWSMENIYFNTFLFNYIGGSTKDISRMVAYSAATAVVTTFVMGALSDKLGKRKSFISIGYIIWGLSVVSFAFISRENIARLFGLSQTASIIVATVSVVIIMDCVMTFFGSTANDAAFNAWVTEVTEPENRGTAEGILAVMPILATIIVTAAFGAGVAVLGYPPCFLGLGILVSLSGLVGLLSLRESAKSEKAQSNYWADLFYGFKPSVIKQYSDLYLILTAVGIFGVAVQIFFPYLLIYLEHYLGLSLNNINISPKTAVFAGLALVIFIGGAIGLGKLVDKFGKDRFVYLAVFIFILGLFAAFFAKKASVFGLTALVFFGGYGFLMIILNATVRDYTPEDRVGLFQGIRMIFFVLLPMLIGPTLGNGVIEFFANNHDLGIYVNEFGEEVLVPVPEIFPAAGLVALFIIIPLLLMKRNKRVKANNP
ncbi:MAG TPA: MFS transporter [Clostridiales bacterium]|nr:MFS transporter [Clostridiales bacterium]